MPRYTYGRTIPDAGSIQDLLERRGLIAGRTAREVGDAQARATYARGQSIGDLIGGLGQLAGQTLTQYADYKAGEPARQLEAAGKIADIEAKAAQAEENRAQAAAAQATSARQTEDADRLTRRETAWLAMFDKYPNGAPPEVLQRETLKIWGPKDGATMLTGLKALSELQQGQVADARDAVLRLTLAYEKGSPAMQAMAWPQIRQSVITAGLGTAETLPEAPPDKTFIAGIKAWASGKEPPSTLMNVPPNTSVIDTADPSKGAVFTAPAAERPEPNPTEASLAAAAAAGDPHAAKALDLLRQQRPEPREPQPSYQWAKDPSGVVRLMSPEEIRRLGANQPDTADMRNKQAGKAAAGMAVQAVRDLGARIFTKVGPAQRIESIQRGAEAIWGTDPEFRTYQDSRMALAGTLAVEQQGSRVSDADVKALWLPMVPDAYRDTKESYELKWKLMDAMRGVVPAGAPAAAAPAGANPFRR